MKKAPTTLTTLTKPQRKFVRQHGRVKLADIKILRSEGISDKEIAEKLHLSEEEIKDI